MLTGRSIQSIAAELDRQRRTKHDFIVPTSFMSFTTAGLLRNNNSGKELPLTDHAHRQVASYLDIPHAYYDRMRQQEPVLLSQSVNAWMAKQSAGSRRMVRVLDGHCRAFLSDRYMPIDNWDVLNALLPAITAAGCEVVSAEVTERRMFIKAVTPRIGGEIKVGDRVQAGISLQNSEIGQGRVIINPLMYRLACSNGLIVEEYSTRRHHVGRRINDDDIESNGIYSRETIVADIKAFLLKARDAVAAVLQQTVFNSIVNRARKAAGEKVENPTEFMEEITDRYNLNDTDRDGILAAYLNGGDSSRWGMVNAITAYAHEGVMDYERSTELETVGGQLLFA